MEFLDYRASLLKESRRRLRMTQKKLAGKLSVTQPALANYEGGKRKVPADLLVRVEQMEHGV